ncbi:sulfite exporter TauE/SafE family protein [Larkinella insperata]|uniref:Sulfite exporter TauE/SafE family protein n=1 Tax=Larkinella insperata TaxID=332158 RepID=A0ABW3Q3A7_9BACT|nr:sulfite exporter TauE/SafE family protein [Larkinella insperata]
MSSVWIIAALTTGLVGSLHCVGMCGPLAMALPVGRLPRSQRVLAVGLYHLSRVTAYAGLGTLAGTLGQGLLLAGFQRSVSVAAGLFLVLWTVFRRGKFAGLTTGRTAQWITRPMSRFLQSPTLQAFAGLGLLNGLLPCGFVYVALTGAVTTGSAVNGAAYMGLFGLGTVPALMLVRFIPNLFPTSFRHRFTAFMPVLTVALGLLLLARGVYPSTRTDRAGQEVPICHGGRTEVHPKTP